MRAAGLLVSRAGATTLAEATAVGRPVVLIPLPTATDDHQRRNAEVLRQAGAAEVMNQKDLSGDLLVDRLLALAAESRAEKRDGRGGPKSRAAGCRHSHRGACDRARW